MTGLTEFLAAFCAFLVVPILVTAEICTKDVCEYEFELSWSQTMRYIHNGEAYRVLLNGTELVVTESMYRRKDNSGGIIGKIVSPNDVITADGVERDIITINGQFPGPTIEVMEGSEIVVRVKNNLSIHGTTIHWHGIYQKGTPFMDGATKISQCAILPGQAFTYRFVADPVGTHWYHSHVLNQKSDGLFGLLIIHQSIPKIPQILMSITDWFHVPSTTLIGMNPVGIPGLPTAGAGDMFMVNPSDEQVNGEPIKIATLKMQSSLINGRGRNSGSKAPLTTFVVDEGNRYRFRVVCAAQEVGFTISIDGHDLDIVALDGQEIMTVRADAFMIHPGESLDFVVRANKEPGQYWIRSEAMQHGSEGGMDHSNMDHGDMDHSNMDHSNMDHSNMGHGNMEHGDMDHSSMDHSKMNHSNMDHGSMDHGHMDHSDMVNHGGRRKRHGDENHDHHEHHEESTTPMGGMDIDHAHHAEGHAHHHVMIDAVRAIFSYKGAAHGGHDPRSKPRECTTEHPCITFGCSYQEVTPTKRCIGIEKARAIRSVTEEFGLDTEEDEVIERFLNVGFSYTSSINARRFVHPSFPPYASNMIGISDAISKCDEEDCKDGCKCTSLLELPLNKTVQLVISNVRPCAESVVHHAIHMHGHNFAVLAIGYEGGSSMGDHDGHDMAGMDGGHGGADDNEMCETGNLDISCDSPLCAHASWKHGRPKMNLHNPPVRDTISIPAKGYAVIRFKTENPGYWLIHCHNSMHFMEGMAILIQEGTREEMPKLPLHFPSCKNFDFSAKNFAEYKAGRYNSDSCDENSPSYVNLDFLKGGSEDTTKLVMPVGTVVICCIAIFALGVITATIPTMCITVAKRRRKSNTGIVTWNRRSDL